MSRTTIARREFDALSREKTIVLAILIQLIIAGFSSFLVVGLTSLYDPGGGGEEIQLAVTGEAADELVAAGNEVEGLNPVKYSDRRNARDGFDRGDAAAIAVAERRGGRIDVSVEAPQSSLQKTLVVVRVRAALEQLERSERRDRSAHLDFDPIPLPPSVDASPYFGFTYTILVPLLVFLPVFISGAVVVDSVTEEVERGTLELLRVTPASLLEIVEGKAGLMAALAPQQLLLWVVLLSANGIGISNVVALVVLTTAAATLAVVFAAALAVTIPVRQRAQLTYSFGALAAFAAATAFPEHPGTTVALLAIDSPTLSTYGHVAGYVVVAAVAVVSFRVWLTGLDAESLG